MFQKIYSGLGLPWSTRVEKKIREHTGQHNPRGVQDGVVHSFKRDSIGLLEHSLTLLTKDQRRTIFDITRSVASDFYSKESFDIES